MQTQASTGKFLILLTVCSLACTKGEADSVEVCEESPPADYLIDEGCTVTDPELAAEACFEQAGDDPERQAQCEQLEVGTELLWLDCSVGSCAQLPVLDADGTPAVTRYVGSEMCRSGVVCTTVGAECMPGYSCECRDHIRAIDGYCECGCSSP